MQRKNQKIKQLYQISIVVFTLLAASAAQGKGNKKELVVAVIDTGVDTNHSFLKPYIDPRGFNFADNNKDVSDINGHGTHIAGIIVKQHQAWSHIYKGDRPLRILPIRYYSGRDEEFVNIKTTVAAIRYAIKLNVDIINYSSGGYSRSHKEAEVLREAAKKGILVIAAAGNHGHNMDQQGFYPAAYSFSNIISVASLQPDLELMDESNFGRRRVDVSALGYEVVSTIPGNRFGPMSGTSQATAFVAGAIAAQLSAKDRIQKSIHRADVIELLVKLGRYRRNLASKTALGLYVPALKVPLQKSNRQQLAHQKLHKSLTKGEKNGL